MAEQFEQISRSVFPVIPDDEYSNEQLYSSVFAMYTRAFTHRRDNKNDRSNKVFIGLLIFEAAAATRLTRFAFETIPRCLSLFLSRRIPHEGLMLFILQCMEKS